MRPIFLSYRRDDTEGQAGRLFQDLREVFGADNVFMDVATIEPGVDFRRAIEKNTESCGVLLALIGRNWLTLADEAGHRRLDDPNDFVRLETASALRRDIPVVPVLLQGAHMPRPEELPEDLRNLSYRNSVELTHARWDSDVQLLIAALRKQLVRAGEAPPATGQAGGPVAAAGSPARPKWLWPAAAVAAAVVALVVWQPWGGAGDSSGDGRAANDPQAQIKAHNEGICLTGFVWREAHPGDKVCVTPDTRTRTAAENQAAESTHEPAAADGSYSCRQGYVWREAYADDMVCVPPASRQEAAADNEQAAQRIVPLPS